jgi:hypothetical protein
MILEEAAVPDNPLGAEGTALHVEPPPLPAAALTE